MLNQAFEDESLNDLEIDDNEFIEAYTAKTRRRKQKNLLALGYLNEEVKIIHIYPLTTLTGQNTNSGLRVANEKTTLMITSPEKVKSIKAYLEEIPSYDLNELIDPVNPTEQIIKNSSNINLTTTEFNNANFDLFYLMTFEKITTENFSKVKKYLGKTITYDLDNDQTDMTFVPIEEFSSLFKAQPVKVVLSEPIVNKIKQIKMKSPVGTLIGNIKAINENGKTINLLADKTTQIFPKLVFPFQTQPRLATVEYWASRQIIPFSDLFEFLKTKKIKFNEAFSLKDFLKLGEEAKYPNIFVPLGNLIKWTEKGRKQNGVWVTGGAGSPDVWRPDHNFSGEYEEHIEFKVDGEYWYENRVSKGTNPGMLSVNKKRIKEISQIEIEPSGVGKITDAFGAVCQMLTESFWKDMEFKGATKIEIRDGQKIETINDEAIYKLQEKYAGQDRYSVTTNCWIAWKRKNPDIVNPNLEIVKRIENAIAMLSGYIKSNYSINKGDNDDYKVLLPYYFELQNKLDNPEEYAEYQDIIVKLKSDYGEFSENGFTFTNKNISKTKIFELEYNHFAFPELTKNVETAMIPSSMPLDQQLANGEYSKYLMLNFANNKTKQELYLKRYGSGSIEYDSIASSLDNEGLFELETPAMINEIVISGFYGYGDWKIAFIDEKNQEFSFDLSLFSRFDNTKSLINLII